MTKMATRECAGNLHDVAEQRLLYHDGLDFLLRLFQQSCIDRLQIHLIQFARFKSVLYIGK